MKSRRPLHPTLFTLLLLTAIAAMGAPAVPSAAPLQASPASPPSEPASEPVLKVEGAVPTPLTLTAAGLAKLPRSTATLTTGSDTITYSGVSLYDLLLKAGWQFGHGMSGKPMASYLLVTASDGYQVVFTLPELDPMFAGETILLADQANGAPLPPKEGPFRIVVPADKMHARSIHSVLKLEVVRLRP